MAARRLLLASGPLVLALAAPAGAAAHLRSGTVAVDYRATVVGPLAARGAPVEFRIYQSDRALGLTVRDGHGVVVLGYLGEPFLRVDARGVAVNTTSPTAAVSGLLARVPRDARNGWLVWSRHPSVVWHDPRLQGLPPGVPRARWRVPVIVDHRRTAVAGFIWRRRRPSIWSWLAAVCGTAAVAVALGARVAAARLERICVGLALLSVGAALLAVAGFALGAYASPGTWLAGANETAFALVGIGVLLRGPRRFRAAAAAGLGLLGLAVGLSLGSIYLHAIVLSVLPAQLVRGAVGVAIGAGLAASILGIVAHERLGEPLFRPLAIP